MTLHAQFVGQLPLRRQGVAVGEAASQTFNQIDHSYFLHYNQWVWLHAKNSTEAA